MGRAWELPTVEVGDTVFLLFGDGIASAESVVYIQRLDDGRYNVKLDTNETVTFDPPMFAPDDGEAIEGEA